MQVDTYTDKDYQRTDPNHPALQSVQVFNPPEDRKDDPVINTGVYLNFPINMDNKSMLQLLLDPVAARIAAQAKAAEEALRAQLGDSVQELSTTSDRQGPKFLLRVAAYSPQDRPLARQIIDILEQMPPVGGASAVGAGLAQAVKAGEVDVSTHPEQEPPRSASLASGSGQSWSGRGNW